MKGRSREEKKGPADEKEQTGPEAQDSQQPSGIMQGFIPVSADPEGSQDSGDSDYRDEEQEREGGRSPAREWGRARELARTPREDF